MSPRATTPFVLAFALAALVGCGAPETPADPPPSGDAEPTPADEPARAEKAEDASIPAPVLADLDALCLAVHDDYGDGTLSDTFAKTAPSTEEGKRWLAAAKEADQPGRSLESAFAELKAAREQTPACAKLFDDLPDLE